MRLKAAFADRAQIGPKQYADFMLEENRERSALHAVGAVSALMDELART